MQYCKGSAPFICSYKFLCRVFINILSRRATGFHRRAKLFELNFSNSLIIHHIKTKKITSVKEVWIPGFHQHRFLRFYLSVYSLVFVLIEKHIKHSRQCFIGSPNTSNFVKNSLLHVIFSTLFSVFGYPNETMSLVFDILHKALKQTPQGNGR